MELKKLAPQHAQVINSYGAGRFRVTGISYSTTILVFSERTVPVKVKSTEKLSMDMLPPLDSMAPRIELLLLGCGSTVQKVPDTFATALRAIGIAVEPMSTGAACRTYNVLAAEGRQVGALLIPVD